MLSLLFPEVPGPENPGPKPIARPGVAGADRTPSGGSPVRRQVHPTSGAAAGRRRCTITFVVSRPSFPLVGAACLVARGVTRSPGHSGRSAHNLGGAKPRASFLRGPSRPEGPRASRWCVAPLRGPHARRHPPTRVWSSPLRGVPSDCVRWVGTGALARRATALRSAARCAGTPRLQECFGGLRASRKSSHSSPKLQVISRKVGDLLRRSSTVTGPGVVPGSGPRCFLRNG